MGSQLTSEDKEAMTTTTACVVDLLPQVDPKLIDDRLQEIHANKKQSTLGRLRDLFSFICSHVEHDEVLSPDTIRSFLESLQWMTTSSNEILRGLYCVSNGFLYSTTCAQLASVLISMDSNPAELIRAHQSLLLDSYDVSMMYLFLHAPLSVFRDKYFFYNAIFGRYGRNTKTLSMLLDRATPDDDLSLFLSSSNYSVGDALSFPEFVQETNNERLTRAWDDYCRRREEHLTNVIKSQMLWCPMELKRIVQEYARPNWETESCILGSFGPRGPTGPTGCFGMTGIAGPVGCTGATGPVGW